MKEIVMTIKERNKLKREIAAKVQKTANRRAFILSLAVPHMVIRDKFNKLIPLKDENGTSRQERFMDYCIDIYDSINGDYVELDDLIDVILKETGVDLKEYKG